MQGKALIFDLDGTLVDSSASILGAYRAALNHLGCQAIRPLTRDIIGPPLGQTLDLLTGGVDPATRLALIDAFKAHYDQQGYKDTLVFSGIADMLVALQSDGLPLYIATNKRIAPTCSILVHLGWTSFFKGVYALDALHPTAGEKAELLVRLLQMESLAPDDAIYVGDRDEDALAASRASLHFERAGWGFGGPRSCESDAYLVAQMADRLRSLATQP